VKSVKHRSDGSSAIEVWALDLSSTESTLAFVDRAKKDLFRLDVVVENAGIVNQGWYTNEGFEQTIQVNVINTLLLALGILPKLLSTRSEFPDAKPHLEIVSSEAHRFTKFPTVNQPDIYASFNDEKQFDPMDRYNVSKLLEILFVRELVHRLEKTWNEPAPVVINTVNPGMCHSDVDRGMTPALQRIMYVVRLLLARSTEAGSRTLVYGACAGPQSHGEYMSDGKNEDVEQWILSDYGKRAQVKVFEQTMKVLEARRPGIGAAVGVKHD
jgi:retinol dehydrogenase 12